MIMAYMNRSRLILDDVKNSAAAYSLRKLNKSATKAIRVTHGTTLAEIDIGFVGSSLDETALLAFADGGSVFVNTWYDQSGNNNHGVQTTLENMPRIVNAGVVEVDSEGNPSVFFNLDNERKFLNIQNGGLLFSGKSGLTLNATVEYLSISDRRPALYFTAPAGGVITRAEIGCRNNSYFTAGRVDDGDSFQTTERGIVQAGVVCQTIWRNHADNEIKIFANNEQQGSTDSWSVSATSISNTEGATAFLGNGAFGFINPNRSHMFFSEAIIFDIALSDSQRNKLEQNQIRNYNIT